MTMKGRMKTAKHYLELIEQDSERYYHYKSHPYVRELEENLSEIKRARKSPKKRKK